MLRRHFAPISFVLSTLALALAPSTSKALEGDWTAGAAPEAILLPAADIYGAGASIFARYAILDSLELGASAGFYGAQQTKDKRALGLYNIRLGANYVLDVLQWVPWVGIYISSIFSEDTHKKWHKDGHGMGIDFDIGIQYRGIRQFGIGLYFSYHLVFTDTDYMTAGITLQWYSGMF